MDLTEYRGNPIERERVASLLEMLGTEGGTVLDIGARDGYLSRLLTSSFHTVVALDLEKPNIPDTGIVSIQGDATCLEFADDSFDAVLCAEVLEHIPPELLQKAADEIARVARKSVVVGVPYKQDIRIGRTICLTCGRTNPPWGHVNVFDELRLTNLFPKLVAKRVSLIGENRERTNALSAFLMDLAGNPHGTYNQEEGCVFCGAKLKQPPDRTFAQRVFTRASTTLTRLQRVFVFTRANWIHVLFSKQDRPE